jgi:hypothetical protein
MPGNVAPNSPQQEVRIMPIAHRPSPSGEPTIGAGDEA